MPNQANRIILTLFSLALVSGILAFAQSPTSRDVRPTPLSNTWEAAQSVGASKGTLFIVTVDQPSRRQKCHIQSFTANEFVCLRAFGGHRTYPRPQIAALIIPGGEHLETSKVLQIIWPIHFGAAIWGTVVLAATCPACAAATAFVALYDLFGAGFVLLADDQPDRLLYLTPGQKLTGKLASIHF